MNPYTFFFPSRDCSPPLCYFKYENFFYSEENIFNSCLSGMLEPNSLIDSSEVFYMIMSPR